MPPRVPATIDQSIILNLGSDPDCPSFIPENENNPLKIIPENENVGNVITVVNTNCSHLVQNIKNPF